MRDTFEIGGYRESPGRRLFLEAGGETVTVGEHSPGLEPRVVTGPAAALAEIVPHAEERLGVAGAGPDLVARFVACLTELLDRPERVVSTITGRHDDRLGQVADWYTELGIAHEATQPWGTGRIRRTVLLRVRPDEPGEYRRTLYIEVEAERDRLSFHESYQLSFPGDQEDATVHSVRVPLSDVPAPGLTRPSGQDVGDRVAAEFAALIASGELGAHLPFRANRDRVHRWYEDAGAPCHLTGTARWWTLPPLSISTTTPAGGPGIEVSQARSTGGAEPGRSSVRAPLSSLGELVTFVERRLDWPAAPHTEDELFSCFTGLATAGVSSVAQVVEVFAEAGVPYVFSGERTYPLLSTYREGTGCDFTLRLTVETRRPAGGEALLGLLFTEYYDYSPRAGDAGREYGYSVRLAPAGAEFVGGLERRLGRTPGSADPEERLVACFRALVERGDLAGDLPLEHNRDKVAEVLSGLGPVETDSSVWVNSD